MTRSQSNWKFMSNGFLVARDESAVIGTFHADRGMHPDRKEEVRALICNAENARNLLSRFVEAVNGGEYDLCELADQAEEILNRTAPPRAGATRVFR